MGEASTGWLTSGQAATLCSVKPDTVQKWIRKGRLCAQRTAGGHYRIAQQDIEPFLTGPVAARWFAPPPAGCRPQPLRCWEYLNDNGAVRDSCMKCVVYRVRAAWCFEVAGLGPEIGHARTFCSAQNSCQDCVYYQRVSGTAKVLVISADERLVSRLSVEGHDGLSLTFTANAYEASALIGAIRPGFVIVDVDLCGAGEPPLLECLLHESRVPGLRIIRCGLRGHQVATPSGNSLIPAWLEKPFDRAAIDRIIRSIPVEQCPTAAPDR
ncbi:MAG: helix-turn-helix domain-containing protein [Acidobacteria bacterium]|nr:helix-turn-helix domain-containing protein [Acidobacteriota bacterium]